jgi:TolA-binding protein
VVPLPREGRHLDGAGGPRAGGHHAPLGFRDRLHPQAGQGRCRVRADERWPSSRFARYCHYWNGRHLQHKKDVAKALESYRTVVEKYPDFALADHAAYGVAECLAAQGKYAEAAAQTAALRRRLAARGDQTAVRKLADALAQRLERAVSAAR